METRAESTLATLLRTERIGLNDYLCRRRVPGYLKPDCEFLDFSIVFYIAQAARNYGPNKLIFSKRWKVATGYGQGVNQTDKLVREIFASTLISPGSPSSTRKLFFCPCLTSIESGQVDRRGGVVNASFTTSVPIVLK
jgi:hypothetical protein